MTNQKTNKQYGALDVFKLLASVIIVGLHSSALIDFNSDIDFWVFQYVGRLAVPLFFLISGFLFGRKELSMLSTARFSLRVLRLYAFYFVINLPVVIYSFFMNGAPLYEGVIRLAKGFLIASTYPASWFLASLVFSAWLITILKRKRFFIPAAAVLYIFCCLCSMYGNLLHNNVFDFVFEQIALPYNSVIAGALFFSIGFCLARRTQEPKFHPALLCVCALASVLLFGTEIFLAKQWGLFKDSDCGLFLIPSALFLFLLLIRAPKQYKAGKYFREFSTVTYSTHGLFLYFIGFIKVKMGIEINHLVRFAVTIFLCFSLYIVFKLLSKKIRVFKNAF